MKRKLVVFLILIFIGLSSVLPLFQPGYFKSDDGEWMVIRFSSFYQELREGQIPPRFLGRLNSGYGYPVADFLYPGFMYIGVPIKAIGFDYPTTIKIIVVASMILSAVGSYLWLRKHFSDIPSLVGAFVYVYFPYHLFDVYQRGSVGELLAFGVLPFLLYTIERQKIRIAGLLYGLLLISHNTLGLLFSMVLVLYTILSYEWKRLLFIPFGLLVSAFFWLPAIVDLHATFFSTIEVSNWQAYFLTQENHWLLGISGLVVFVISLFVLFRTNDKKVRLFACLFFVSIFLSIGASSFLWNPGLLPKVAQFPWRFLSIATIASAFLVAFALERVQKKYKVLAAICVIVCFFPVLSHTLFAYDLVVRDPGYYSTNEGTSTVADEYRPISASVSPLTHPLAPAQIVKGTGSIQIVSSHSNTITLQVKAHTNLLLEINKVYFPGWIVMIDGKQTAILFDNNKYGLLRFAVSSGNHTVTAVFGETPLRKIADIISLVSLLIILGIEGQALSASFLKKRKK